MFVKPNVTHSLFRGFTDPHQKQPTLWELKGVGAVKLSVNSRKKTGLKRCRLNPKLITPSLFNIILVSVSSGLV